MNYKPNKQAKDLFNAILALKSERECKQFLRDLLTEAEIKEFSNRWKVANMLNSKIDYIKIEKETGMSSTTIARISQWLKNGMGGYRLVINRMATHQTRLKPAG